MAVFKRKRTNRSGKKDANGTYTIELRDNMGVVRRFPAFRDKAASFELERNLSHLIQLAKSGGNLDVTANAFLESCSAETLEKLADWGIIPHGRSAQGKPVKTHIDEWRQYLASKSNTPQHVRNFTSKVCIMADDCRWRAISDITIQSAQKWLAEERGKTKQSKNGKRTYTISAATCNVFIRAAKGFCGWLLREERLTKNPLLYWSLLNEKTDRRLERRALTVEEVGWLLEVQW